MDYDRLQLKIYKGYEKVARRVGTDYEVYRVTDPMNPLGNLVTTLKATFNAQDWGFARPNLPGKPFWYGVLDGTLTLPGDILVGATATYYIAAMQPLLPILCIEASASLSLNRQSFTSTNAATEALTGAIPASVVMMSVGGGRHDFEVSTTMGQGNYKIHLPNIGVAIQTNDVLSDAQGFEYIVKAVEYSDYGYRLMAERTVK